MVLFCLIELTFLLENENGLSFGSLWKLQIDSQMCVL